jgi:hypothetical protein
MLGGVLMLARLENPGSETPSTLAPPPGGLPPSPRPAEG